MCNIILYPCVTVDLNIDLSVNHIHSLLLIKLLLICIFTPIFNNKGHIKIAIL